MLCPSIGSLWLVLTVVIPVQTKVWIQGMLKLRQWVKVSVSTWWAKLLDGMTETMFIKLHDFFTPRWSEGPDFVGRRAPKPHVWWWRHYTSGSYQLQCVLRRGPEGVQSRLEVLESWLLDANQYHAALDGCVGLYSARWTADRRLPVLPDVRPLFAQQARRQGWFVWELQATMLSWLVVLPAHNSSPEKKCRKTSALASPSLFFTGVCEPRGQSLVTSIVLPPPDACPWSEIDNESYDWKKDSLIPLVISRRSRAIRSSPSARETKQTSTNVRTKENQTSVMSTSARTSRIEAKTNVRERQYSTTTFFHRSQGQRIIGSVLRRLASNETNCALGCGREPHCVAVNLSPLDQCKLLSTVSGIELAASYSV